MFKRSVYSELESERNHESESGVRGCIINLHKNELLYEFACGINVFSLFYVE